MTRAKPSRPLSLWHGTTWANAMKLYADPHARNLFVAEDRGRAEEYADQRAAATDDTPVILWLNTKGSRVTPDGHAAQECADAGIPGHAGQWIANGPVQIREILLWDHDNDEWRGPSDEMIDAFDEVDGSTTAYRGRASKAPKQGAILFSGGMDSVILAIIARSRGYDLIPFFMSHRANVGNVTKKELRAASKLAKAVTGNNLVIIKPPTKTTPKWYSDFGMVEESGLLPVVKGAKDRRNRVFIDVLNEFGMADGVVALGLFGSELKEKQKSRADDIIPSRLSKYLKSIGAKGTILSLAEYAGPGGEPGGKERALKDLPASAKKHVLASESCLMWFGKPCGDCWSCMDRVKSITGAWGKDTTPYRAGSKADKYKKGGKGRGSQGRGARRPTMPASAVRAARAGFWRMRLRAGDEDREVVVLKSDIVAALKGVPAGARLYAEPIRARSLRDGTTYTRGIRLGRGSRGRAARGRGAQSVETRPLSWSERRQVTKEFRSNARKQETRCGMRFGVTVTYPGGVGRLYDCDAVADAPGGITLVLLETGSDGLSMTTGVRFDEVYLAEKPLFPSTFVEGRGEGRSHGRKGGWRPGKHGGKPDWRLREEWTPTNPDNVKEAALLGILLKRPGRVGLANAPSCPLVDIVEFYDEDTGEIVTEVQLRNGGRGAKGSDPFMDWCAAVDAEEAAAAKKPKKKPKKKRSPPKPKQSRSRAKTGWSLGDLVMFGRKRGEKTIGEIVGGIGSKRIKVRQLVRRRAHPIGSVWRVQPSLLTRYTGPRPASLPEWDVLPVAAPPPKQPRRTKRVWTHDLDALLAIERKWFPDGMFDDVRIKWSSASRDRRRSGIRLGTWHTGRREIKCHPTLDRPEVPEYVLRNLIFHELLHGLIGVRRDPRTGKRVMHGPDFKRLERAHPDYDRAKAWTKKYLGCLAGREDWSKK